jgi:hypothetical protein
LEKDLSVSRVEELAKEDDAPKLFRTEKHGYATGHSRKMQADLKLEIRQKSQT